MKIYYVPQLSETQICLEHKSKSQTSESNARQRLLKRQLYLIYRRILPKVEPCLINMWGLYVCFCQPTCLDVRLSLSDVEPEPTFSLPDLHESSFWGISGIFYQKSLPNERPFLNAVLITDPLMCMPSCEEPEQRQEGNILSSKQTGWRVGGGSGKKKSHLRGKAASKRTDICVIRVNMFLTVWNCLPSPAPLIVDLIMQQFNLSLPLCAEVSGEELVNTSLQEVWFWPQLASPPCKKHICTHRPDSFACEWQLHTAGFYLLD